MHAQEILLGINVDIQIQLTEYNFGHYCMLEI